MEDRERGESEERIKSVKRIKVHLVTLLSCEMRKKKTTGRVYGQIISLYPANWRRNQITF